MKPDLIDEARRGWAADVTESDAEIYELATRILYLSALVEQSFEQGAAQQGLNAGEVLVLDTLRRMGPPYEASPAWLKAHFLLSFAGIGKRITHLEELGYVGRRAHATDGRSQMIRLTKSGLNLLHAHQHIEGSPHIISLKQLSMPERRRLAKLLRMLQKGIEAAGLR